MYTLPGVLQIESRETLRISSVASADWPRSLAYGLLMFLPGASAPTAQDGTSWPYVNGGSASGMHSGRS